MGTGRHSSKKSHENQITNHQVSARAPRPVQHSSITGHRFRRSRAGSDSAASPALNHQLSTLNHGRASAASPDQLRPPPGESRVDHRAGLDVAPAGSAPLLGVGPGRWQVDLDSVHRQAAPRGYGQARRAWVPLEQQAAGLAAPVRRSHRRHRERPPREVSHLLSLRCEACL